jgi:hypothetical protein
VESRRLGGADLVRAHRAQRELVGEEQLGERQPGDDDEHDNGADARPHEHGDEADVEKPEEEHRQEHPGLQAPVAAVRGPGGGHAPKARPWGEDGPSGGRCIHRRVRKMTADLRDLLIRGVPIGS